MKIVDQSKPRSLERLYENASQCITLTRSLCKMKEKDRRQLSHYSCITVV